MNSTDSVNYESDGHDNSKACLPANCPVDTSMQGAEIQDSPRGGSVNSSSSSLSPIRVDASTAQGVPVTSSQFPPTCATPIPGHQILVDPITGQHYLVPSSAQTHPQFIYQPVYYATATGPPVFYQSFAATTQGALLMPSLSSGQHNVGSLVHPAAMNQRLIAPSIVSSKLASIESETVLALDSPNSRLRNATEEHQRRQLCGDGESCSPPLSPSYREKLQYKSLKTTFLKSYVSNAHEGRKPSPLLNVAANDASDLIVSREQRTPLYGASPAWWGEEKVGSRLASDDQSHQRSKSVAEVDAKNVNSGSVQRDVEQDSSLALMQKKKPIRMDIDFSKPLADYGRTKEEKPPAVMRVPPTSFTVSFGNEENASEKEKLSLQDAARRSTSRRLLRRNAPATRISNKSVGSDSKKILAETADPKQYLFKKMLMGEAAVSGEGFSGAPEFENFVAGSEKKDIDMISEAGTYVVDDKDRSLDPMVSSRCLEESDNESDSSDSTTATTSSNSDQATLSYAPIRPPDEVATEVKPEHCTTEKKNTSRCLAQQVKGRRETQKLYDPKSRKVTSALQQKSCCVSATVSNSVTPATTPSGASPRLSGLNVALGTNTSLNHTKRIDVGLPSSPRHWGTTINNNNLGNESAAKVRSSRNDCPGPKADSGQIRRVDGGRFSMRTASSGRNSDQNGITNQQTVRSNNKVLFRVGSSSSGKNVSPQKGSAEMNAWLRRKDYNPMKAAAEARKLQQLKSRSDQFTANRSISFHQGSTPIQSKTPFGNNLTRSRYNKSQDDLCEESCCGSRSVLATYSKGVSENLNRLKLAEKNADTSAEVSGVQKAVEQLALKCYRSIDLIRNAHQGHLPDSVEDLLNRATKPDSIGNNSVAEQVSRLSAAFDAIQKYLEVSSCASPTPSTTDIPNRTAPSQLPTENKE